MGRDLNLPLELDDALLHRAGSGWTDRGTAWLNSKGPGSAEEAVRCNRRAVELLGSLPIDENPEFLADLGAAWANLGCALQACGPGHREEAAAAFLRALEFLGTLPLEGNHRFRHNLAAAWMNRAGALGSMGVHAESLHAYEQAMSVARELPLEEKPSFRILLASCRINRGNLLMKMGGGTSGGAATSYKEALAALGPLPATGHRAARHHAATAATLLAEALLEEAPAPHAGGALEAARTALAELPGRELGSFASADLVLRALRAAARALEGLLGQTSAPGYSHGKALAELTAVIERGFYLASGCRERSPGTFDPLAAWFFATGCRVYGRHQPQFLAEFIGDCLRRVSAKSGSELLLELRKASRDAVEAALGGLGRGRMLIAGTPQTEHLLRTVRGLQEFSAHLN